ncbi:hypothetical protein ACFL27_19195 [candidate division CSSED10-310 bacterium]|uniref:DUF1997 domain-containing protein n=1 Tax=candidate division CSSED10-310 bacterium TaxID=2855610 RepID=A0ABV6Z1P1_UNCC1
MVEPEHIYQQSLARLKTRQEFLQGEVLVDTEIWTQKQGRTLLLIMVGKIAAAYSFTRTQVLNFNNYPPLFDFVRECLDDRDHGVLTVKASLFLHRFSSTIDYVIEDNLLTFSVREGTLKGCSGLVELEDCFTPETIISISGQINRKRFPVPDVLIHWGAQWILAKGARNFKEHVESAWQEMSENLGK